MNAWKNNSNFFKLKEVNNEQKSFLILSLLLHRATLSKRLKNSVKLTATFLRCFLKSLGCQTKQHRYIYTETLFLTKNKLLCDI